MAAQVAFPSLQVTRSIAIYNDPAQFLWLPRWPFPAFKLPGVSLFTVNPSFMFGVDVGIILFKTCFSKEKKPARNAEPRNNGFFNANWRYLTLAAPF